MSVTGPTKAELVDDVVILVLQGYGVMSDYVNFRNKPKNWYPTEVELRRTLMARTRDQLWNALDNLTAP